MARMNEAEVKEFGDMVDNKKAQCHIPTVEDIYNQFKNN